MKQLKIARRRAWTQTLAAGLLAFCLLFCCGCASVSLPGGDSNQSQSSSATAESAQDSSSSSNGDQVAGQNAANPSDSSSSDSDGTTQAGDGGSGDAGSSNVGANTESGSGDSGTDGNAGYSGGGSATPESSVSPAYISVSVYIDSSAASNLGYPSCMASATVSLASGASAYDALLATGVSVSGSSTYVSAINGLAEKALGGTSGWMYSVNGVTPMTAAGRYALSQGDQVRWYYVDTW